MMSSGLPCSNYSFKTIFAGPCPTAQKPPFGTGTFVGTASEPIDQRNPRLNKITQALRNRANDTGKYNGNTNPPQEARLIKYTGLIGSFCVGGAFQALFQTGNAFDYLQKHVLGPGNASDVTVKTYGTCERLYNFSLKPVGLLSRTPVQFEKSPLYICE